MKYLKEGMQEHRATNYYTRKQIEKFLAEGSAGPFTRDGEMISHILNHLDNQGLSFTLRFDGNNYYISKPGAVEAMANSVGYRDRRTALRG